MEGNKFQIENVFELECCTIFKRDSKVYYLSEMNENVVGYKSEQKRQHVAFGRSDKETGDDKSNFDYEALRAEYSSEIDTEKKSNDTLDFIDAAQNASFKHKFEQMFNFTNGTDNCTKGESSSYRHKILIVPFPLSIQVC